MLNTKLAEHVSKILSKKATKKYAHVFTLKNRVEKKAESINYRQEAMDDAKYFIKEFKDTMVEMLVDNGEISDDIYNDYDDGDRFVHENYTDKWYSLLEAAQVLDQLSDFEETDSGLWEGQAPKDAISTQAAFTYSSAVVSFIVDKIKELNSKWETVENKTAEEASKLIDTF